MAVRVVDGSLRGSGGRKAWLAAQLNATVSARMVFARCQHDDAARFFIEADLASHMLGLTESLLSDKTSYAFHVCRARLVVRFRVSRSTSA